jgi:ketosteroid isomerase-like protein
MRGKAAFAAATRAAEGKGRIEGTARIQEIQVSGDLAYCWNDLTVVVHPAGGGVETRMTGPALSIFRRTEAGRWEMLRDANMIAPATRPPE